MFPLSSPGEAGSPSIEDLVESAVEGQGKGALEKGAAAGPSNQDRSELLKKGLEMAAAESHVIEGERD